VFIAKGGIEFSTPSSDPEEIDFHGKSSFHNDNNPLAPALPPIGGGGAL